jgi:hypothetical protein
VHLLGLRDEEAALEVQPSSRGGERLPHRPVPGAGEGTDVAARDDGGGACLFRERRDHVLRMPGPDDERGTADGETGGDLAERLEEEPRPVRRRSRATDQPRIQDEHGDHGAATSESRGERRVIPQAKVASQPEEGDGHDIEARVCASGARLADM